VKPAQKRAVAHSVQVGFRLSERRACRLAGMARSSYRYRSAAADQTALRLRDLAAARVRSGYRRRHILLRREVQVRDGTPTFLVNEIEVTEGMDLSWLLIPQTGNAGVVLSASASPSPVPPSALLKSFGIYALDVAGADGRQTKPSLVAMLPTQDELPADLILLKEGTREAEEITATFPDPDDVAQRFTEWGWQETAYRDFASHGGTTSVSVSLHRFAGAQAAAEALSYLAEARGVALRLNPITVAPMGDQVEAVEGTVAKGREVSLYVRQGAVVARITVTASTGDPLDVAVSTAMIVLTNVAR
jgi:hypothetical protein